MKEEQPQSENEITVDVLKKRLEDTGISTAEWGTGQAKTLDHLKKEIESGEITLTTNETGELLRKVVVGKADIYYKSPDGVTYRLKEDRQVFNDGRERHRDLGEAVSEKMKSDENSEEAIVRGIKEELGIDGEIILTKLDTDEESIMSPSYPGLKTQYIKHKFKVVLNDDQFNLDGYVEKQSDKSTYFTWE